MKVGIVGFGVVGSAIREGFKFLGHEVFIHDIKLRTKLDSVLPTDICFLCVPTPASSDGSCNTDIVEEVVGQLDELGYTGVICIKSTVTPGTTKKLQSEYPNSEICFVPEFLRERCAPEDFIHNHDICIIGASSERTYKTVVAAHGTLPKNLIRVDETEAELSKYFNNVYNATLITFANSFYEICKKFDVNYTNVKSAIINREHINDVYLDCRPDLRGFGGMCLPKDTKNLAFLCDKYGIDVDFFKNLLDENDKYEMTVFEGMRKK
jgi:UDPglucose 6-dehydrogenase